MTYSTGAGTSSNSTRTPPSVFATFPGGIQLQPDQGRRPNIDAENGDNLPRRHGELATSPIARGIHDGVAKNLRWIQRPHTQKARRIDPAADHRQSHRLARACGLRAEVVAKVQTRLAAMVSMIPSRLTLRRRFI